MDCLRDGGGSGLCPSPPPPASPYVDPERRLEIDIVYGAGAVFVSLLLVQWLHWRPSALLTHGGLCMLVGAVLNAGVWAITSLKGRPQVLSIVISPSVHAVVYFAFLPPIIFEAGFSMSKRGFFDNLVPILLYAVAGTLISTFSAGFLFYALSSYDVLGTDLKLGEALLFAALISPTDPVATLSVLRQVSAPPALRNCIFGEATLNDALSIVLFNAIRRTLASTSHLDVPHLLKHIAGELAPALLGALGLGVFFGLAGAFLTRQVQRLRLSSGSGIGGRDEVPHFELALVASVALLTFTASERLDYSGIMGLFVCGATTRHYTYHNLSREAQRMSHHFFLSLATLAEMSLTTLLGVGLFNYLTWLEQVDLSFCFLIIPVLFLTRALNIFPLSALANACRSPPSKVTWQMQVVMWFSGMRGALSFALAVSLNDRNPSRAVTLGHALFSRIVAATLFTIAVTTLLMAPATRPLIRSLRLGQKRGADDAAGDDGGNGGGHGGGGSSGGLDDALLEGQASPHTLDYDSPIRRSPDIGSGGLPAAGHAATLALAQPPQQTLAVGSGLMMTPPPLDAPSGARNPSATVSDPPTEDETDDAENTAGAQRAKRPSPRPLRRWLRQLELDFVKPIFGGRYAPDPTERRASVGGYRPPVAVPP